MKYAVVLRKPLGHGTGMGRQVPEEIPLPPRSWSVSAASEEGVLTGRCPASWKMFLVHLSAECSLEVNIRTALIFVRLQTGDTVPVGRQCLFAVPHDENIGRQSLMNDGWCV